MLIRFFALTLILVSGSLSSAAGNAVLGATAKKYRNAKLVEMSVEKVVTSELLGKTTNYTGKIAMTGSKFRWETSSPEKSLLVYDGTYLWTEQTPPKELGGDIQVAKGKVDKKSGTQTLLSSLVSPNIEKEFQVEKQDKVDGFVKLKLSALQKKFNAKDIQVTIDPKVNAIQELSYKDDVDNLTVLKFSKVRFLTKGNNKLFQYKPPKGAQVTDL